MPSAPFRPTTYRLRTPRQRSMGSRWMSMPALMLYLVSVTVPEVSAQPLYNIGAREYTSLFHDSRLSATSTHLHGAGFVKLDSERLPGDLDTLLARQAFFPVTSSVEMAGQAGENAVADAVSRYELAGENGAWDLLATRDASAWSDQERHGRNLFFGEAGCADCHAGGLLTDHGFHAIAMPQIGPGKAHGTDRSYLESGGFADRLEDEGRYRVTLDPDDLFRFRTPSLRNVPLTDPWGHAGSYDTLSDVVRHHLDPLGSLERYRSDRAERALTALGKIIDSTGRGPARRFHAVDRTRRDDFDRRRGYVQDNEALRARIAGANELVARRLSDIDIASIVAFLHTLVDPDARDQSHFDPATLPSGLTPQPTPSVHAQHAR